MDFYKIRKLAADKIRRLALIGASKNQILVDIATNFNFGKTFVDRQLELLTMKGEITYNGNYIEVVKKTKTKSDADDSCNQETD